MHQQLVARLTELRAEYESGQKMLAELKAKQRSLRDTLLRISGAIQVLEEELAKVGNGSTLEVEAAAQHDRPAVNLA